MHDTVLRSSPVMDVMHARRSIRAYTSVPVEQEKLHALIAAAQCAPSACNAQPWRFVFVTDAALRVDLCRTGMGGAVPNHWAKSAPVILVACAERSFVTHTLGENIQGVAFHLIDMGIALEHIALRATELGLGSCYIGWFNEKPIKKMLSLPRTWQVVCLMTLGYPALTPEATSRRAITETAFFNQGPR